MRAPRLLGITSGEHSRRDLVPRIQALGEAGLPALLIREPHLDRAALEALADAASRWVPLVILHRGNPHAATLPWPGHAPAAHLSPLARPADGGPPSRPAPVGFSCHGAAELDTAFAAGAVYALLSPVWRPTSKPDDRRPPLGVRRFLDLAAGRPVLGLGGVDADGAVTLVASGGWGVAVLGALFGPTSHSAAAERCRALVSAVAGARAQGPTMKNRSS